MAQASTIAGGAPTQATAQVSADQVTIGGNGTPQNPLHGIGGGNGLRAYSGYGFLPALPIPGRPLRVGASATTFQYGDASALATAIITGVLVRGANGQLLFGQSSGDVVLTADEWDAVAGTTGGLTPGAAYYVSTTAGELTEGVPVGHGDYISLVGIAIDEVTLQLQLTCAGNQIP